ncbi:MAG: ShlB/FhaC/HecB family hemolysin secretion/activation protein, partial [Gemmatimonadaceae bacterium]
VRVPCDLNALTHSPDLPPSIYDPGEEVFSTKDRDDMMKEALTLADQAPFSLSLNVLPAPSYSFGLPMTRFNRVEGLSTGIAIDQELGAGLSVGAVGRIGFADRNPNVEITAKRSNLSKTLSVSGYHRLAVANDWGNPLSFGSSFSALMFGKDEGFYYRATGGDAMWARGINSRVEWRVFAENQRAAPVRTQMALVHRSSTDTFPANIDAENGVFVGSSLHLVHNHGLDPRGFRTFTDAKLEAATSDSMYGRGSLEVNLSRGLPFATALGLTLSGGSSVGHLPPQRRWYLGGTHSVRGQSADTAQSGNAYWLSRLELARDYRTHRSSVFGDLGWVGDRNDLANVGRPLSGVGYGESMFDGILRMDVSRGLYPRRQWRFDVYLEARF